MNTSGSNSLEYCRQKAAPEGSSLYYSLLYQQPDDKPNLYILHAFHNALTGVISECSDPGVAHVKFAWWQEEIQRLTASQPRHPVTKAMDNTGLSQDTIIRLGRLVEHYDRHIDLDQPGDYRQLMDFLQEGPGSFWQLLAETTGYSDPETPSLIRELGTHFGYFQILQEQPWHQQFQRKYIPANESRPAVDNPSLYSMQLERLENELTRLADLMPGVDRRKNRHALTLARIIAITCRENRRAGSDLSFEHITLTPVRKLWIAWQCKWRYR